ncbi:hypothetical protein SAMN04487901_10742 [Prevotella communis]|uniref:HU domain-containing protein n=2 Tax=Prevotella communis TaxID=2913614 RepID=A0A1H0I1M5_9BACT|nr:hypothetical protein SAMN04487901_10742 [Prevotella communis]SDO25358.1 hypothetical protein SAMN04487900_112113 [Prevotella communis]
MWYEVHPTPVKGEDGKNLVYVRPKSGQKLTMKELEEKCEDYNALRYGELSRAFDAFIRVAGRFLAEGYRIETPIGSFAPKLSLAKQVTDASEVKDRDVRLEGVEYNPGKLWNREIQKWMDGFRRWQNADTQEILANKEKLEQVMRECIQRHHGYITASIFSRASGLTLYSARKQLNEWTKGNNPKLLMTPRGKEHIYTEI